MKWIGMELFTKTRKIPISTNSSQFAATGKCHCCSGGKGQCHLCAAPAPAQHE